MKRPIASFSSSIAASRASEVSAARGGPLVDLGLAAKVRPGVVLSIPAAESDRALVTLVPHTTAVRGSRFEVNVEVRFLRAGGFDAQNLVTIPLAKLLRPLGRLAPSQLGLVESAVAAWLGLAAGAEEPGV